MPINRFIGYTSVITVEKEKSKYNSIQDKVNVFFSTKNIHKAYSIPIINIINGNNPKLPRKVA